MPTRSVGRIHMLVAPSNYCGTRSSPETAISPARTNVPSDKDGSSHCQLEDRLPQSNSVQSVFRDNSIGTFAWHLQSRYYSTTAEAHENQSGRHQRELSLEPLSQEANPPLPPLHCACKPLAQKTLPIL